MKKILFCFIPAISFAHPVSEVPAVLLTQANASQLTASTHAVTRSDITEKAANNLSQTLSQQPSLQIIDANGDGTNVILALRGFAANAQSNTLILINGQPLTNPDLSSIDLNKIPLHTIERIEVSPQSGGTLYGDGAVGGVINIITKQPEKLALSLSGQKGSYNHRGFRGGFSDVFANGFSVQAGVDNQRSDNYRDHNATQIQNYYGQLGYDYQTGSLRVNLQHDDNDLQLPGALNAEQLQQNRRQNNPTNAHDKSTNNSNQAQLTWQQFLSENLAFNTLLSQQNDAGDFYLSGTKSSQQRQVNHLTPQLLWQWHQASLNVGAPMEYENYQLTNEEDERKQAAIFARMVYPITHRWQLTLGTRYAHNRDELSDDGNQTHQAWVSEQGLRYVVSSQWSFYLRHDGNFRFPKVDEEMTLDSQTGQPKINPLKTQTGHSYEWGSEWQTQQWHWQWQLYQLDLNNEIAYAPSAIDPSISDNRNLPKTQRRGFSLASDYQLTTGWRLHGQYSYVNAKLRAGDDRGNDIPFVSKNLASLASEFSWREHWRFYLEGNYTGQRYAINDDANAGGKLGGYTIYNMALNYETHHWLAALRMNNLANKKFNSYTVCQTLAQGCDDYYYPAAQRNLMLHLQWDLG